MPVRTRTPVTCTFTFQCVSPGDAPLLHILNTFHCLLVLEVGGGGGSVLRDAALLETEQD